MMETEKEDGRHEAVCGIGQVPEGKVARVDQAEAIRHTSNTTHSKNVVPAYTSSFSHKNCVPLVLWSRACNTVGGEAGSAWFSQSNLMARTAVMTHVIDTQGKRCILAQS
jgi:hypothetical protein